MRSSSDSQSKKRPILIICLGIINIFMIGIIILLVVLHFSFLDKEPCLTPQCIQAANKIIQNADFTVNPCDDFYHFACGKFVENNVLESNQKIRNANSDMSTIIARKLKSVLEKPVEASDISAIAKIKYFYRGCMNMTHAKDHSQAFLNTLMNAFGDWPVININRWREENFDVERILLIYMHYGANHNVFFTISPTPDRRNLSRNILMINQPNIEHYHELLEGWKNPFVEAYYKFMIDVLRSFTLDEKNARNEMKEVVNFEMELARTLTPIEQISEDVTYTNIGQLHNSYPYIQWVGYINTMLQSTATVDMNEEIIVLVPEYFQKLGSLLQKTPKRVLANYMMWKFMENVMFALNSRLRKLDMEFKRFIVGSTSTKPLFEECIDNIRSTSLILGAIYVKNFVGKSSKTVANEMVSNILEIFNEVLGKTDWMDDSTLKKAQNKLRQIRRFVAYPDELLNDNLIDAYYRDLEIDPNNFLSSYLGLQKFLFKKVAKKLREPNGMVWEDHANSAEVNAFYDIASNSIEIPAAILQGDIFNLDVPQYINYATLGAIIAHEIVHGFDETGSFFDAQGNLDNWWEMDTKNKFQNKVQCFVNQYSNVTVPQMGMRLNGINTKSENIADNVGIKIAFLAYQKWKDSHGEENNLPGVPYTSNQNFWIAHAQRWCTIYTREALKQAIDMDPHAPAFYRVRIPFKNSNEFANTFSCPVNSGMNPAVKCAIW